MGFVVENHDVAMAGNSVSQGGSCIEGFGLGNGWSHPGVAVIGGFLAALFVEAVNVGEVERSARGCTAGFILQDDGEIPIAAPFG
ncbi:MAG: hypothetical protein ACKPCM_02490, partial [Pseudanabaena sp.]